MIFQRRSMKHIYQLPMFCLLLAVTACSSAGGASSVVTNNEPAMDATLAKSPTSLRIFFTEAPNAEKSAITLTGPNGDVELTLLHTMGMNDLMIFINDLPLTNGQYQVKWQTLLGDNAVEHKGSYQFTVAAPE